MVKTVKGGRCPNGQRKDSKTGLCKPLNKKTVTLRKKCSNGTRKNKEGNCVSKTNKSSNIVPKKLFRVKVMDKSTQNVFTVGELDYYEQKEILEGVAKHLGIEDINVFLDESNNGDLSSYFILYHKKNGSSEKTLKSKGAQFLNKPFEVRYRDLSSDIVKNAVITIMKL